MDYVQACVSTCGLKSLIDMKTRLFDNFLPKTKHYFEIRNLEAVRDSETIDLEAETLHSCQNIDWPT